MGDFDGKVYAEVYEVIGMLSEKERRKIPEKWQKLIDSKRDKEHKIDVTEENVELLPDTEKILSVIYTDYLATEEEQAVIKAKENGFVNQKRSEIANSDTYLNVDIENPEHQTSISTEMQINNVSFLYRIRNFLTRLFRR